MKKMLVLLGLAGTIALASCSDKNEINNSNNDNNVKFSTMYDYSAISGISMLNSNSSQLKMRNSLTDVQKDKVINNFEIIEDLIAGGITKSEEKPSDLPEYETMYTISVNSINGEVENYLYYYNETILKDDDDDDLFDFDDEEERESRLDGIVILDGVTYNMYGKKEIEGNEMEVEFKISLDNDTYVKVEQETENGEEEYKYTKYENGRRVYQTEMEVEEKNHKVEFNFKEKDSNGITTYYKYDIIELDGKKYVRVHLNDGTENIEARLEVSVDENGNRVYTFS